MKATELRVGNLLDYKNGNITIIAIEDFAEIAHNDDFLKLIKPIPLTEEWLVKFGFKDTGLGSWVNKIHIRNPINNIYKVRVSDNCGMIEIKHVHQL